MNNSLWLLSLPLKHREINQQTPEVITQDRQIIFNYLKDKLVTAGDVCQLNSIELPEFKTGTLDSLVTVNDQLAKHDTELESLTGRLLANWKSLLEGQHHSALLVGDKSTAAYVKSFSWNRMKYRVDEPIGVIMETIVEEAHQIDTVVKNKMNNYLHAKSLLNQLQRKNTGSLLTRNLNGIVNAEDVLSGSEYMQSAFFVINQNDKKAWMEKYEGLVPLGAVPRSARLIVEDAEHALFAVVLMKKTAEEYMKAASLLKFVPRNDFTFDPEIANQSTEATNKLESDVQSQWSSLMRLINTNFGEVFAAWIHVKVLRLHVESILHYGLPPSFLSVVLEPTKSEQKINKIFLHVLEKLSLPGISQLDLTAALLQAGLKNAKDDALTAHLSAIDATEEAELWSQLNASEGGNRGNSDPFVNFKFKC